MIRRRRASLRRRGLLALLVQTLIGALPLAAQSTTAAAIGL